MALPLVPVAFAPVYGQDAPLHVFAAASLKDAVDASARLFKARTGLDVTLSYGASSVAARQIARGAPADIYLAADTDWMDYLQARDGIVADTRLIVARNALVVVAPAGTDTPAIADIGATGAPWARRFNDLSLSMADPAHVPAGRYARQALQALGLWDTHRGARIYAANVRAALFIVARAEADVGIVYASDVLSDARVRLIAKIPDRAHKPIVYPGAVVGTSRRLAAARAFLQLLVTDAGQEIFAAHGFLPPAGRARKGAIGRKKNILLYGRETENRARVRQ